MITHWSYGTNLLYHLVAGAAGLAGGQVAVVAFLQVDAGLGGSLHFELVHSGTGLGDVQIVRTSVRHNSFLLFIISLCVANLGIASIGCVEKERICFVFDGNF